MSTETTTTREVVYDPGFEAQLLRWRDEAIEVGPRLVDLIERAKTNQPGGREKRLGGLPNTWSRRITSEHRLIYVVTPDRIRFVSCWSHDVPDYLYEEARKGMLDG